MLGGGTPVHPAKTDKPIDTPFGGQRQTRVGPRKHVLDGVHSGTSWLIRLSDRARLRCGLMSNYLDHLLKITAKMFSRELSY